MREQLTYEVFVYLPTSLGGQSRWLEYIQAPDLELAKERAFTLCWHKHKTAITIEVHKGGQKLASRKSTENIWTDYTPNRSNKGKVKC